MLLTRTGAYRVLYEALKAANQSGAYTTLIRVPTEVYSKPLTYLGILPQLKNFQDVNIEVNGKTLILQHLFPAADYDSLQKIFLDCLTELEIYDTFVIKQRTFVLATQSVPPKPPYYIPRSLSNRIKIPKFIFKSDCSDVFVFRNTIARYELSQIVYPNFTSDSSSQLTNVTCRFIYLDQSEDWTELKKIAKAPIHLINYEAAQEKVSNDEDDLEAILYSESTKDHSSDSVADQKYHFVLEDSSAAPDFLKKLGSKTNRVYLSENQFLNQQLSEDSEASSICICDTPGMGKTLLLANIARHMMENCNKRIIVFIPLATFSTDFEPAHSTPNQDTAILNVLKYTSTCHENKVLLRKLIQAKTLQMEIFFDGFDEIPSNKYNLVKKVFLLISTKFKNVRMYITARPHVRQDLESSLGLIAYDILPFNRQNQIDFLTHFWTTKEPKFCQTVLQGYAASCLKAVNKSLTEND